MVQRAPDDITETSTNIWDSWVISFLQRSLKESRKPTRRWRKTQKVTSIFTFFNEPWLLFNYKWRWTEEKQKYRWFLHDENKSLSLWQRRQRPPERGRGGVQMKQWLNSTKLIFLTLSSKMKKNIYTQHQNMKTIVSSPSVYHVGDYVTRLLSNMVTKSAWVQTKRLHWSQLGEKNRVQTGKNSQNQELMEKRPGHGKKVQNKRIKNSRVNNRIITVTVICWKNTEEKDNNEVKGINAAGKRFF